ncbi:amino acid adenylation domain-containing protein [Prosthecobacter fusiformis]|uniref:Amino acid adenylation domain-containing protein n=1 Tax=Prosthecobacter fusiformis TaxID=48464 RepID=A0A4R7RJP0_9BACT|nr:class I adenylate-forming enzyme family protein [Prosthecobacter fusiformis]TDU62516.1 amino acid adenylation domain-containing protein [Prosthecobacter fusiformis]
MTAQPPPLPSLPCQWLAQATERWPERVLVSGSTPLTFKETQTRVNHLAAWLHAQGIQKGDRVVVVMPNRVEVLLIILAALQEGVIFSILSHQMQPEGLQRILTQCEAKAVFLDASTAHLALTADGCAIISVDEEAGRSLFEGREATPRAVPLTADDLAFLVFTSGSTGTPRGVMLTHGNVAFVSPAIQVRLKYQADDCIGIFLPLAFDYSLYQLFYACLTGASLFLGRPEMVGPELPKILAREGITILPGVPTVFAALIKMQRFRPAELPRLRMITNTGDHLPQAYIQQIQELLPQVQVVPMFGLTECKRVSIILPEEMETHLDSVGRPLDGTTVFTVDEHGQPLPAGEAGELAIQGPHVSPGYWQSPEETAKRFRDLDGVHTLFTGDQGQVDSQGFITFLSRSDFVIKHRGTRLSPAEVEEAAYAVPQVVAAGCVKDDRRDLLCLFLSTTHDHMNEAGVLTALATRLERGKLPDRVYFLPELPRTSNQKLDRKALRNLLPQV